MGRRPLIEYEISPCFEVIEWQGEKGEVVDLGRIAFPPKSAKQKAFSGRKVSFVFRGRGYRDPYTGSELRKGYVIALPIDVLNDVEITEAKLGLAWISEDFSDVKIEMIVYYEKEHKGKRIKNEISHYKSVSIASIINKPVAEVLSSLFGVPQEKIKYRNVWLDTKKRRDGYVIKKCELRIVDGKFVVKDERKESLYYAPLEVLLQKIDTVSATVYGYFTTDNDVMQKRTSFIHPCLEDYFALDPLESAHTFDMHSEELRKLLKSGKLEIKEIIMRKVHTIFGGKREWKYDSWNGEMSFDRFLQELKDYDVNKLEEQLKNKENYLEEIHSYYKHYYVYFTKEKVVQLFQQLTHVSIEEKIIISFTSDEYRTEEEINRDYQKIKQSIKEILSQIDKGAWIKVLSIKGSWDGMYNDSKEEISIIIPKKCTEIQVYHKRYTDGYEEESGEFINYEINRTELTEEQLRKQEMGRKQEVQRLNREIDELKKKIDEIKQKNPRELYNSIVRFFEFKEMRE